MDVDKLIEGRIEWVSAYEVWVSCAEDFALVSRILKKNYDDAFRYQDAQAKKYLEWVKDRTKNIEMFSMDEARKMTLSRLFAFNSGLSLECILKAYIIKFKKIDPLIIKKEKGLQLTPKIGIHNIADLIKYAELHDEVKKFEIYKYIDDVNYLIVNGKYPSPKLIEEDIKNRAKKGLPYSPAYHKIPSIIEPFYQHIKNIVEKP